MIAAPRRALLACLGVVLACTKAGDGGRTGPRLTVRWTGADTAAFAASATAERCDTLHLVEIQAISGDTGVGLALYDSGALRSGTFPDSAAGEGRQRGARRGTRAALVLQDGGAGVPG